MNSETVEQTKQLLELQKNLGKATQKKYKTVAGLYRFAINKEFKAMETLIKKLK